MAMNKRYLGRQDCRRTPDFFPLSGCLLLPRVEFPQHFRTEILAMVDRAMASDRLIGVIQPLSDAGRSEASGLFPVDGRLTRFAETGDGRYIITLEGVCRFLRCGRDPDGRRLSDCRL